MSFLFLASRFHKLWDGDTIYSLHQYRSSVPLLKWNLRRPLLGATEFSFATSRGNRSQTFKWKMYCFVDRKLEEIIFNQHSLNPYDCMFLRTACCLCEMPP